jgi:hypothetical protein
MHAILRFFMLVEWEVHSYVIISSLCSLESGVHTTYCKVYNKSQPLGFWFDGLFDFEIIIYKVSIENTYFALLYTT